MKNKKINESRKLSKLESNPPPFPAKNAQQVLRRTHPVLATLVTILTVLLVLGIFGQAAFGDPFWLMRILLLGS